mmetsp:Transcript_49555/g.114840  ORF Transcript_49555/g.114840 Transcript_49555/m.114840 type:complete len:102 (+) Transcript_49555:326-631(+)
MVAQTLQVAPHNPEAFHALTFQPPTLSLFQDRCSANEMVRAEDCPLCLPSTALTGVLINVAKPDVELTPFITPVQEWCCPPRAWDNELHETEFNTADVTPC